MLRTSVATILATILLASSNVWAARGGSMSGFILGLDLSQFQKESDVTALGTSSKVTRTVTSYDANLGYVTSFDLYLGATYVSSTSEVKADDATSKEKSNAYGPSIGLFFGPGFSIIGSYLLGATSDDFKDGTGMQADLGWRSELGRGFFMGFKLSYRSVEYTKHKTFTDVKLKEAGMAPYVSLGFLF